MKSPFSEQRLCICVVITQNRPKDFKRLAKLSESLSRVVCGTSRLLGESTCWSCSDLGLCGMMTCFSETGSPFAFPASPHAARRARRPSDTRVFSLSLMKSPLTNTMLSGFRVSTPISPFHSRVNCTFPFGYQRSNKPIINNIHITVTFITVTQVVDFYSREKPVDDVHSQPQDGQLCLSALI